MSNHKYRTHNCNELGEKNINQKVRLSGWVYRKRDHGGILFLDLKDDYGITQIVVNESLSIIYNGLSKISLESVITVDGVVIKRKEDNINPNLDTGNIELDVSNYELQSLSGVLPFNMNDESVNEDLRLEYRFLDLRKKKMHHNLRMRHQIIRKIRHIMYSMGFEEFQTPILTSTSPEGAKDFLVPSRVHKNKYYALPQAPQQFKQLLMMSGFDKYFQIAPCFRDEDARADRSPGEFYQVDIEMSFATQEDVFKVTENLLYEVFSHFSSKKISNNFTKIKYQDALLHYGTDKPDLRNPLQMQDVTNIFVKSSCTIFSEAIEKRNNVVKCIKISNCNDLGRSFFKKATDFAQEQGAKGLAYLKFNSNDDVHGPILKFMQDKDLQHLRSYMSVNSQEVLFFICDVEKQVNQIGARLISYLGENLNLIEKDEYKFCWITDFPFFEMNEGKIVFSHNPFSMPDCNLMNIKDRLDYLKIQAQQYDIVCNGIEISSGAVRNHKIDLFYEVFRIAGYTKFDVDLKFPAMVKGLKFGPPPHAGIAPGLDRIIMLLLGNKNIRDVIAFPMNGQAQDVLMKSPCNLSDKEIKYLNIKNI